MKIQSILLLIVSIILVVVSSWNVRVFIRLSDASHQYSNDDQFDSACHVSKKYVKTGKIVSIIILVLSILLMIGSSVSIYRNNV
jgi:uncharacterized phage infection (PIP) family protein YhgE